jgi:hypothetical protein
MSRQLDVLRFDPGLEPRIKRITNTSWSLQSELGAAIATKPITDKYCLIVTIKPSLVVNRLLILMNGSNLPIYGPFILTSYRFLDNDIIEYIDTNPSIIPEVSRFLVRPWPGLGVSIIN